MSVPSRGSDRKEARLTMLIVRRVIKNGEPSSVGLLNARSIGVVR
jgi:hypothetical protein